MARSLMLWTVASILISAAYELAFIKSFTGIDDRSSAMCVIEYPSTYRSVWISIHQIVSVSPILLPLLINLCSTLTIMGIVIKNKVKIRKAKLGKFSPFQKPHAQETILNFLFSNKQRSSVVSRNCSSECVE